MARSSAATAAPPPAKRRKPAPGGSRHATTQTHRRPERRTSGPAKNGRSVARKRPVAAAGARSASAAAPRVTTAPRRAPRARTGATTSTAGRIQRAAPLVRRIAEGRGGALLDRLLRGRACVALVFALLVGIVFFNVSLLEMNEGIANTNAKATELEQKNAELRRAVAPLASSERIQTEAVKRGYSLPAAGDVGYIRGDANANAKKATQRMTAPGMGEGTASRPAAEVQAENQAAAAPEPTPTAPATPEPAATTPTANCQPAANCQLPTANSTAAPATTAP